MAKANCITDTDWAKVFTSVGLATDLSSIHFWLATFLILFILSFLIGVVVLCHVMKKVTQGKKFKKVFKKSPF